MGNRINVRNAGYAVVSVNNGTTYTMGTKTDLPNIMNIDLALTLAQGILYGEGAISSNQSKLTGAVLKIGLNKLKLEDRAAITGATITNGILSVGVSDQAPTIAFYAETEADDGTKEELWLLAGEAVPPGLTGKQTEQNINFSTDEITINFSKRKKDGLVLKMGDTENSAFTATLATSFSTNPDATP